MMHALSFAVAPESPSGLALAFDGIGAELTWHDNSLNATGFVVERSTSPDFSTEIAAFAAQTTRFVDTSMLPATAYWYRVKAVNTVGDDGEYGTSLGFPRKTAESECSGTVHMPAVQAVARASATSLIFGEQRVGAPAAHRAFAIENTGSATLQLSYSIAGEGQTAYAVSGAATVPAGGSAQVDTTFSPLERGSKQAMLVVSTNDPDQPTLVLDLRGTAVAPVAVVSSQSVLFDDQVAGTTSAPRMVVLSNEGDAPLAFTMSMLSHDSTEFMASSSGAPVLAPGESRSIAVTFRPGETGPCTAKLVVGTDDVANLRKVVELAGHGIEPLPGASSLVATIGGIDRVHLQWTDLSSSETSFLVCRSTNGGPFIPIQFLPRGADESQSTGGIVAAEDTTALQPNLYAYFVVAVGAQLSAKSNQAAVLFAAPAAPSALAGSAAAIAGDDLQDELVLDWTDNAVNESGFEIQRASSSDFSNAASFFIAADTQQFVQHVSKSDDYYVRVRARNALGASAWSTTVFVPTP